MSDGTRHLPVAIGDDWEGRHHDHSTEVERSWAVAQLVARNHNLTVILTDLIAELRIVNSEADLPPFYDMADRAEKRLREVGCG